MNCRKQLGICAQGESYTPPKTPLNLDKFRENPHICAYLRNLFHFLNLIPGSINVENDSYKEKMQPIMKYLFPNASEKLINQNLGADTTLHYHEGLSFENFSKCVLSYIILSIKRFSIQDIVDTLYDILCLLDPSAHKPGQDTLIPKIPAKLPLTKWDALIQSSKEVRPCYVIQGVNTQRTKLFEKILAETTGALLLDIPDLIEWEFRTPALEDARQTLLKGGYLHYKDSLDLIIDAARSDAARYRGWILPAAIRKNEIDITSLFGSNSEFEKRCFLVDLDATLEDLIEISKTRQFDPVDQKIITNLPGSSLAFVQRLKRREFVGREFETAEEEAINDSNEEEDEEKLMLYKAPSYSTPEQRGDEAHHLEEEEGEDGNAIKDRLITLPEESTPLIKQKYDIFIKEKEEFKFNNSTKHIIIDSTQPLNEMAAIVRDKSSVLFPCIYPKNISIKKQEEGEDGDEEPAGDDEQAEGKESPVADWDIVALSEEMRLVKGDPSHAILFYGRKFLFENDDHLKKFVGDPTQYLQSYYHSYHHRILIIGPQLAGKKSIASQLSEFFDTEIVDFDTLITETKRRIIAPKEEELAGEKDENNKKEEETKQEQLEEQPEQLDEVHDSETTATYEQSEAPAQESEDKQSNPEEEQKPEPKEEIPPEQKEEIPPEDLPPIYENGYISIVPSFEAGEQLKIFMKNEKLAPEVLLILKLTTEGDILQQRLSKSFEEKGIEQTATEITLVKVKKEVDKWNEALQPFLESIQETSIAQQQVDANLPLEEVFWQSAYFCCPILPRCSQAEEECPQGYFGSWDPVILKQTGSLATGENTAVFDGATYTFSDETTADRFRAAPLAFIGVLPPVPPPKLLILGGRGSGKSSISDSIVHSQRFKMNIFEIPSNPKFEPINEEEEAPDPEETTRKTIEPFLEKITDYMKSHKHEGWIIEGTPENAIIGQMIIDSGIKPDLVIFLDQNETWALLRNRKRYYEMPRIQEMEDDDQRDEAIKSEVEESSAIAREVADAVAETTVRGETVVIDTSRRLSSTMKFVNRLCEKELTLRKSLFVSTSAESINSEDGDGGSDGETPEPAVITELRNGDSFLSQFGRYCPVCLKETGNLVMTDLSIGSRFLGRLFFFDTEKHRKAFSKDPLSYVFQQRPPRYPSPPNISVIGSPALAEYLADQLEAELIRPRDVIARVAQHETTFGARVRDILAHGKAVDSGIFKTALKAVLSRQDCQLRGWVLDGFPTLLSELKDMRRDNIPPKDLIIVDGQNKPDEEMVKFAITEMHNVISLKDEGKVWKMGIECVNAIREKVQEREAALLAIEEGKPYCVGALDISPEEVEQNLGEFKHYCPIAKVCNEVTIRSGRADWKNICKFNGKFYHPSSSDAKLAFLQSPIPFVVHWGGWKPEFAEMNDSKAQNLKPEVEGYDIVELSNGKFVMGSKDLCCIYRDKLYWFNKKLHRDVFCKFTMKYADIKLPEHRPVEQPKGQLRVQSMPTVAFLEQSVGNVVTECIVELTVKRPKIPGETLEKSLNMYIAAYIKAHMPEATVGDLLHQRFVDQLNEIEDKVALAAKLKQSLETPIEMRDEAEHERLCKLWEETTHK